MAEAKRFAIIEDMEAFQDRIAAVIEVSGHIAAARAGTMREARDLVERLNQLKIDAVTLDGNLTPNQDSGREGRELLERIRVVAPNVKVIGMSGLDMPKADIDVGKRHGPKLAPVLAAAIHKLFD